MGKMIDLTGQHFGKWFVVCKAEPPAGYEHLQHWLCRCECGAELVRRGSQMRYAQSKGVEQSCQSCGAKRHGHTGTSTHKIWIQMRDRCRRESHAMYHRYGGRGITVCERWNSFANFLADMGERPSTKHTLDRIDNDKGYGPDNCRWTSYTQQNRNKSSNKLLTHNGKTQCVSAWSEETGIHPSVLYSRIHACGWSVEAALTTPVGVVNRWNKAKQGHGQLRSV